MPTLKKHLIVSGLIVMLALFFYSPVKAAESIPATGQQVYPGLCTSVNQWFMTVGGPLPSGTTHSTLNDYPDCSQFVYDQQAQCVGGTIIPYQQLSTNLPWPGGQDDVRATINCPGFYVGDLLIGTATLDTDNPVMEYSCPEGYELNGQTCDPIPEPNCSIADSPIMSFGDPISANNVCMSMPDGVSNCSYSAVTESDGSINGYTFTPTGESCNECTSLGTKPCVNGTSTTDDIPETPPQDEAGNDQCFAANGVIFCAQDEETRCSAANQCDNNCAYVAETLYCADETQPDAEECTAGDTRPECSTLNEGDCPPGFDCSEPTPQTTDTDPCLPNDPRAGCQGRAEGQLPDMDLSAVEGLLASQNANIQQTNINTADIARTNRGIDQSAKGILDTLNGAGLPNFQSEIDAQAQEHQDKMDTSDQDQLDSLSETLAEEASLTGQLESDVGYFGSFVSNLIPSNSSSCSAYVANYGEHNLTIDFCQGALLIKTAFAWIVNVAIALYVFFAFARRAAPETN